MKEQPPHQVGRITYFHMTNGEKVLMSNLKKDPNVEMLCKQLAKREEVIGQHTLDGDIIVWMKKA